MQKSTVLVNPYPDSSRKKGRWLKPIKLEITPDTTEMQSTKRDYYNQLYVNDTRTHPSSLEEMNKFLESYNLPRMTRKNRRVE